jgi:hypothetical protein
VAQEIGYRKIYLVIIFQLVCGVKSCKVCDVFWQLNVFKVYAVSPKAVVFNLLLVCVPSYVIFLQLCTPKVVVIHNL